MSTTYKALILPWDEPASQFHPEHPRRRYSRGSVHMPRKDLKLTDGHGGPVVGLSSSFVSSVVGIEATIKLGLRGEELVAQGQVGLSPEIDEDTGNLIGVALATDGPPAFASARIMVEETASAGFMAVATAPRRLASTSAPSGRSVTDLGAHRREMATYGMRAVDAEVAEQRRKFEERQLELLDADIVEQEQRLLAAGVPMQSWPTPRGRRARETALARQVQLEGEQASRDFAERMGALERRAERVRGRR